jgi:hypothetical protein
MANVTKMDFIENPEGNHAKAAKARRDGIHQDPHEHAQGTKLNRT